MENINENIRKKTGLYLSQKRKSKRLTAKRSRNQLKVDIVKLLHKETSNKECEDVVIGSVESHKVINNNSEEESMRMEFDWSSFQQIDEEPMRESEKLIGRRIVDIQHLLHSFISISTHCAKFGCTMENLKIVKEIRHGLESSILLKCNMCNDNFTITTNEPDSKLNTLAVEGIMGIGCGYYNLEEFLSCIDIPAFSEATYKKNHDIISDVWEKTALLKMQEAAKKEAEFAIRSNNVDSNGIPCITVIADGTWSKRSYKTNYNALSGAAAIVGQTFGDVLYIGIKNKYCVICAKSATIENEYVPKHVCYKNYSGPSTGMEAAIIVEGFKQSIPMYGLKYTKIIADGDSSMYKKILEEKPYKDTTIEKIECRNHLLRNFCNKLKILSSDTRHPITLRRALSDRILRMRRAIVGAVQQRKSEIGTRAEKLFRLKSDIDNIINHVFGDHQKCATYFCNKKDDLNVYDDIKKNPEFCNRLQLIVKAISNHSRSLLYDVDNNKVEQFNSIIAKFVGGKRINYSKGRSYQSRCYAAVVSHNSKRPHYEVHKILCGKSPSQIKKAFELRRQKKIADTKKNKLKNKAVRKNLFASKRHATDAHYGPNCEQADMDPEIFIIEKRNFIKKLQKSKAEIEKFEKETILQADSEVWLEERRKLLTASNFSRVCSRRPYTSCANLVKYLLYSAKNLNIASLTHGKRYEDIAKQQLEDQLKLKIEPCGMFIDGEHHFLGATPDGLVGNDTIIEIKCPYSAYKMSIDEAITEKKIKFWVKNKSDNNFVINKNHSWYFQIQGQLRITRRKQCILGVWASQKLPMKIETIEYDNEFWKNKMEEKLIKFYTHCILPELVDPRHTRQMPIRDPEYIVEAAKKQKDKRTE